MINYFPERFVRQIRTEINIGDAPSRRLRGLRHFSSFRKTRNLFGFWIDDVLIRSLLRGKTILLETVISGAWPLFGT